MDTPRELDAIELDLLHAQEACRTALSLRTQLEYELASRYVHDALAAPHPWLGKHVQRYVARGASTRRQHGHLLLCTNNLESWGFRGFGPSPGQYYVLSLGGKQAYPFDGEWALVP